MNRPTVRLLAAAVLVVMGATAAGCGGSTKGPSVQSQNSPSMTVQQATDKAKQYANEAVAGLPGASLQYGQGGSTGCDDNNDGGPGGRIDYAEDYDVLYQQLPDNTEVFNQIRQYWTDKGYKIYADDTNKGAFRRLTVENPKDGYRISLYEGDLERLYLSVSAPCFVPKSGSPSPGS